jgi:hypothetical protein
MLMGCLVDITAGAGKVVGLLAMLYGITVGPDSAFGLFAGLK